MQDLAVLSNIPLTPQEIDDLLSPENAICRWCGKEIKGEVYIRHHEMHCSDEKDLLEWASKKSVDLKREKEVLSLRNIEPIDIE
jgi:hypothetical protein